MPTHPLSPSSILSTQSHPMMMMMYFHLGIEDTFLIKGWEANNVGG